jgi:uncharacterized glyoxalase superfamily protein PhnB
MEDHMSTIEGTSAHPAGAHTRAGCEPRLAYEDEKAALAFLTTAFSLRELARMEGPDAGLMAWLGFGESSLMIGRSGPEHHNLYSPRLTGKPTAEVNVIVDDIDLHFQRASAAGAVIDTALQDAPFGQRHYEAIDPEGHGWHFMKPLEDAAAGKATPERLELRLVYADELAALEFLNAAFGFREVARLDFPDGSIMAWLAFGDSVVMIGRADAAHRHYSPKETGRPTAMVSLQVDEIDAHYMRAVTHGARIVIDIEDTPWRFRRYEAVDPEGNRWHVMQELA